MKLIESSMRRQLLEVRLTSFHNLNATIEHQTLNDELAFVQLIVLIYSLIDHNNFHLGSQVDTHLHWITISSQSHVARRLSLFNNYSIMTRRLYNSIANIVVSCFTDLSMKSFAMEFLMPGLIEYTLTRLSFTQWYWPFMPFLDWLALYYFGLMFIEIIYLCIFTWLDNLGQHV